MTNRRQFIQAGVAGSLAGTLASTTVVARALASDGALPGKAGLPLHLAVFDERFPDSVQFGHAAARRGIDSRATQGDVTELWYLDLHPLWKQHAVPIAGLTTYAPLFCLERLAWDHGMRVIYRGAHYRAPDGSVRHELSGTATTGPLTSTRSLSGGRGWPLEVAALMARIELPFAGKAVPPAGPLAGFRSVGGESRDILDPPLYSWVIAPLARA